jgi:hypothetical protein
VAPRHRRVGLAEALEDVRQKGRADPLPCIPHGQDRGASALVEPHLDAPTPRRELHRVHRQVPAHLLERHKTAA